MKFGVIGLNHGHIYLMVRPLLELPGVSCAGFYATEDDLAGAFSQTFPGVTRCAAATELLDDPEIDLIVSAAINADRGLLAAQAFSSGKHVFLDKPAVTTPQDLDRMRQAQQASGKRLFVFFSERLENPLDEKARQLVLQGAVGDLVHLSGQGPHRLRWQDRPAWMWDHRYGGILNDLGSHQVDWFCWMTGQRITSYAARIGRFGAAPHAAFDDFGDAVLTAANGVTGYFRVDWFTPEKSPIWGDVRSTIIGTRGTIEIRRTINLSTLDPADRQGHLLLINDNLAPTRVDATDLSRHWPADLVASMECGDNRLHDEAMLWHVLETTLHLQAAAVRVR